MKEQLKDSDLWWLNPLLPEYKPLFPPNIIDILVRSYAVVEAGGISGTGTEKGRNFERLFYKMCNRRRVHLTEKAGSVTVAEKPSASGLHHEVDAANRSVDCITQWELKYLSNKLEKNDLLIFNGKSLDFFQGSNSFFAKIPFYRFILSGGNLKDESRNYALLWGITIIEPGRLPLPILYEAVSRGASQRLSASDQKAVRELATWSCRSLQAVIQELNKWATGSDGLIPCGVLAHRYTRAALDLQEQIGQEITDYLDEICPEWIDNLIEQTWKNFGGW